MALIIGFWIVGIISRILRRSFIKSKIDADLIPFLVSLVSVILKILVVITAAGVVGIEITAFAALIAGAGLAIGAAMSGTLGHFASGVMVLIFKPALNKVEGRLPDAPTIEIEKFDENNVLLAVRPYATDASDWDVYFNSYKEIKKAFGAAGIEVAYPTRRVKNV